MARRFYPSDHRRWFRVTESILDDPKFNGNDWILGAYIRTLAMLNRTKGRDGILRLDDRSLGVMMGRSRRDVALKRLQRCVNVGLMTAARYADYTLIMVPKWAKVQELAPAKLRQHSGETPLTTPTPKTTPTPTKRKRASPPTAGTLAPELLAPEQCEALQKWAQAKGHPATPEALTHAWETVRGWSHAGGKRKPNWYATAQNAIRDGWAFKGFSGNGAPIDRSKMTFEEIDLANRNESNRKLLTGELDADTGIDSGAFELALRSLPGRRG